MVTCCILHVFCGKSRAISGKKAVTRCRTSTVTSHAKNSCENELFATGVQLMPREDSHHVKKEAEKFYSSRNVTRKDTPPRERNRHRLPCEKSKNKMHQQQSGCCKSAHQHTCLRLFEIGINHFGNYRNADYSYPELTFFS